MGKLVPGNQLKYFPQTSIVNTDSQNDTWSSDELTRSPRYYLMFFVDDV